MSDITNRSSPPVSNNAPSDSKSEENVAMISPYDYLTADDKKAAEDMEANVNRLASDRELIAHTFQRTLHVAIKSDTLSSLVDIVLSCVDDINTSATELKSLANYHINNIILLNKYSSKNYNVYMEMAWGRGYIFDIEQSIDGYIMAWNELGDFDLRFTTHHIFYNQGIWSNEDMLSHEYSGDSVSE